MTFDYEYYEHLSEWDKFLDNLGGWSLVYGVPVGTLISVILLVGTDFLVALPMIVITIGCLLCSIWTYYHIQHKYPELFNIDGEGQSKN